MSLSAKTMNWWRGLAGCRKSRSYSSRQRRAAARFRRPMVLEVLESRLAPATAFLSMPNTTLVGNGAGGTIANFPINISPVTEGLSAVNVALSFPTGVFTFPIGNGAAVSDLSLGTVCTGGFTNWNLTANCTVDGVMDISLSAKPGKAISPVQNFNAALSSTTGTLTIGTTYTYTISATLSSGSTMPAPTVSVTPVSGMQSAALTWTALSGATGYKIYRTTTGTFPSTSLIATITSGSTVSFADTGVAASTGAPPAIPSGTVVLVTFPVSHEYNGPSGSAVGTVTPQPITISAVNGTFNTQITGYSLSPTPPYSGTVGITTVPMLPPTLASQQSYSTEANTPLAAPTTAAPALSPPSFFFASGGTLTVGTTYYYVVTAVGPGGESGRSDQVSATPTSGDNSVRLSWSAVSGATSYNIYRSTTSNEFLANLPTTGLVTSVTAGTTFADEGNTLTAASPPPTLLDRASDPQGTPITVNMINGAAYTIGTAVPLPSGASLTVNQDGSFSYVPAHNFVGTDTFTFAASDVYNLESNTATVTVSMTPTLSLVPEGSGTLKLGDTITEDVLLDNPMPLGGVGPVAGFNIALTYDPNILSTASNGSQTALGTGIPSDWTFTPTLTPGVVGIGAFGSGSGTDLVSSPAPIVLCTMSFTVVGSTTTTTDIDLQAEVTTPTGSATTGISGANSQTFFLNPSLPGQVTSVTLTSGGTRYTAAPTVSFSGGGGSGAAATVVLQDGGTDPGGDPVTAIVINTQGNGYTSPPTVTIDPPPAGGTHATATASIMGPGFIPGVDTQVNVLALPLSPSTLPNGDVNVSYNQTISATGGAAPYTFAVTSGTLPTGVTLSTSGVLSGTPSLMGSYAFTITATDSTTPTVITGDKSYAVTINPVVAIGSSSLANWTVDVPGYNQTISATGGTGSYTFTSTGTLPTGLTLSSTGVLSGTPAVPGIYNFTVTATDTLGATGSKSYMVAINPALTITTTTLADGTAIVPGYSETITATGGTGALTFSAKGALPPGLTLSSSGIISGTPTTTGSFSFVVTASDSVGATASQTYTIIINPGNPTQLVISAPSTATAGMSFTFTVTAEDAGDNTAGGFGGTVTLSSSLGADITPASVVLSNGTATIPVTLTTAGTQTITATATGLTSASTPITVGPGAFSKYLVAATGSSTVQAGIPFFVTVQAADPFGNAVTSYSGPASVTVSTNPTSSASSFPTTVAINSFGFGFLQADLQQVGSYTVTAASGSFMGSSTPVTVTPGAPAGLEFAVQPVSTPTGDTLPAVSVQVVDAYDNIVTSDNSDSITLSLASGPGSFTATSLVSAIVHNGVASFNNLTLVVPGKYTLSAVLPGRYIANSAPFTVQPLQVLPGSFAASPSGFSLQFNAPFLVNSLTPILFGTEIGPAKLPIPSVTLTQTLDGTGHPVNHPVVGSLVLDTANNAITFVATNTTLQVDNGSPVLPDGTYTVVIHSSAANNGFQALNFGGGFLDGLGIGAAGSGDYTQTFVVNAGAAHDDVVWVPAAADGPGEPLSAPGMNAVGGGYPVFLNDGTGLVSNVQLTLNYNPSLLNVTGVTGPGFALLASSTAGSAVLQYNGPALPAGVGVPIGFVTATVPAGTTINPTPYKAKDLLHLSNVSVDSGAVPVATSDALHLVAYVGDGDGNGFYSANDGVVITKALVEEAGLAAYPLVDPVIVADTDGAGFIPADAPLQANEAGVGLAAPNLPTPAVPPGVHFHTISNNVDPRVSIPSNLQAGPNGLVTVPINIDDAHPAGSTGLIRAQLALSYDARQFSVSAGDIHLGSVPEAGSGWTLVPTIDPETGQIAIGLSSTTPIQEALGGSLVTIDFHQRSGEPGALATGGFPPPIATAPGSPYTTSVALVASVNPNGQYVATELEDAQGTFTLTPAPTNDLARRIEGTVTPAAVPAASVVTDPVIPAEASYLTVVQPQSVRSIAGRDVAKESQEGGEPGDISRAPETIHLAVSSAASAAAADSGGFAGFLAAAPLNALLFQPGSAIAVNVPAAVMQKLADQVFQTWARESGSYDLAPVNTALARQLLLTPSISDSLDDANGYGTGNDLDCQGTLTGLNVRRKRDAMVLASTSRADNAISDRMLEQYFTETAVIQTAPDDEGE